MIVTMYLSAVHKTFKPLADGSSPSALTRSIQL